MNIYATSAIIEGNSLVDGDEIGIFDGDLCVGMGVVNGGFDPYMALVASTDDPGTPEIDGFIPGNEISFKVWISETELEMSNIIATYSMGDGIFQSQGTVMLDLESVKHYEPIYSGNPYLAMNIYITNASIDDDTLVSGDEIGIFDGDLCVGSGIVNGGFNPYLALVASTDDPSTPEIDGFTPGNEIIYKLWNAGNETENDNVTAEYSQGDGVFISQGTIVADLVGLTNQAPIVINPIPDINIDEDAESFVLADLDTVFSDPDEDSLTFSFLCEESNLIIELDSGLVGVDVTPNWYGFAIVIFTATDGINSIADTVQIVINSVNDNPTQPIIIFPEDGVEVTGENSFAWTLCTDIDIDDIVAFQIQIDDSLNFNSLEINDSIPSVNEKIKMVKNEWQSKDDDSDTAFVIQINMLNEFENLSDDVVYNWRVRAIDNKTGASEWAGDHSFFFNKMNTAPLPVISGFNPADSISVSDLAPTISWNAAVDPDLSDNADVLFYTFQLSSGVDFSDTLFEFQTEMGITYVETGELVDNSLYVYRIKVHDDEGLTSEWSEIQFFIINSKLDPPNPFSLLLPANGIVDTLTSGETLDITFEWESTDDPDLGDFVFTYVLAYSTDSTFMDTSVAEIIETGADTTVSVGLGEGTYFWRVAAVDTDSLFTITPDTSQPAWKIIILKPVKIDEKDNIIEEYSLAQNYPNPFNPSTNIAYSLPKKSQVSLIIYDILGHVVKELVNVEQNQGCYTVVWNGRDANNNIVSTGMYVYQLKTGDFSSIRKMVFMK